MSTESAKPMNQVSGQPKPYLNSEQYRQMLVRDGERRFREWHAAFLEHQKAFRAARESGQASPPPEERQH